MSNLYELKENDWVLARHCKTMDWKLVKYQGYDEIKQQHIAEGTTWKYCLPFNNETKWLVDTPNEI